MAESSAFGPVDSWMSQPADGNGFASVPDDWEAAAVEYRDEHQREEG